MADVIVENTTPAVVNPFKGRIPTVEGLTRKISRIRKIMVRAEKLSGMLPELERKLTIVSDPNFASMTESRKAETLEHKADRAEKLLATLPADVVAAILAKLGK